MEIIRPTAFLSVFKTGDCERLRLTHAHTRLHRHIPCTNASLKRTRRYQVAFGVINEHLDEAEKGPSHTYSSHVRSTPQQLEQQRLRGDMSP